MRGEKQVQADVLVRSPAVIGDACVGKLEETSENGVIEFLAELRVAGRSANITVTVPPLSRRRG